MTQFLISVKDRLLLQFMKCRTRVESHYRENWRTIDMRKDEHQRFTRLRNLWSTIAEHHIQPEYKINLEETKIIVRILYYHQKKIREDIEIYKTAEKY